MRASHNRGQGAAARGGRKKELIIVSIICVLLSGVLFVVLKGQPPLVEWFRSITSSLSREPKVPPSPGHLAGGEEGGKEEAGTGGKADGRDEGQERSAPAKKPPASEESGLGEVSSALESVDASLQGVKVELEQFRKEIVPELRRLIPREPERGAGWFSKAVLWVAFIGILGLVAWFMFVRSRRRGGTLDPPGQRLEEERIRVMVREALGRTEDQRFELIVRHMGQLERGHSSVERRIEALEAAVTGLRKEPRPARYPEKGEVNAGSSGSKFVDVQPYGDAPDARASEPLLGGERFSGPVREIKSRIPPSAKDMEFHPTHNLLVEKWNPGGRRFKVFTDRESQRVKVIPWMDAAHHRQELAWLDKVFEIDWKEKGDISVVSHPSLQLTSEGYRVMSQGHLRVG